MASDTLDSLNQFVEERMRRQMQKLFEYAILYHPKPTKEQRDSGQGPQSVVVTDVTRVLAKDPSIVMLKAARSIPEEYVDKLDSLEIVVRPF